MNLKEPIIIIANGAFPESQNALKHLDNSNSIICLDGATNKLIDFGKEPSLIIGDLDSIKPEYKKKYHGIIIKKTNQNRNDLRKALDWLNKHKYKDVKIIGAAGDREDHFIANIFGILDTNYSIDIQLITDFGVFQILKKGAHTIPSYAGQVISFFTSKNPAKVSASLLKYSFINKYISDSFSYTLNESLSESFNVDVQKGKVLLFTSHKNK